MLYREKKLLIEGATVKAIAPVNAVDATNAVVVNPHLINEFQLIVNTRLSPKYMFLFNQCLN